MKLSVYTYYYWKIRFGGLFKVIIILLCIEELKNLQNANYGILLLNINSKWYKLRWILKNIPKDYIKIKTNLKLTTTMILNQMEISMHKKNVFRV